MSLRILAACSPGEVRVAVADGDLLADYAIWRPGAPDGVGDLHRGRVVAQVSALGGAFIAIEDAEGFLPDRSGATGHGVGELLNVRVVRAAQGGKGPRLALLDHPAIGPARRLERGPGPLLELAAAYPHAAIETDDAALLAPLRPVLGDRARLVATAFPEAIEDAVAELGIPDVTLSNGMRLSIHPTPALVAIDVDSGGTSAARLNKAAAQMAANRAMLPDLARQIRLRNLSGAILVDFAGLPSRKRAALRPALEAALANDRLAPRLLGFTQLGLAEIVRPRVHPPLHEILAGPHAAGLRALRAIDAAVHDNPARMPSLRAAPPVVAALQSDPIALPALAARTGRPLLMRSDPTLGGNAWIMEVTS